MSLLMDALRKAEEAKRKSAGQGSTPDADSENEKIAAAEETAEAHEAGARQEQRPSTESAEQPVLESATQNTPSLDNGVIDFQIDEAMLDTALQPGGVDSGNDLDVAPADADGEAHSIDFPSVDEQAKDDADTSVQHTDKELPLATKFDDVPLEQAGEAFTLADIEFFPELEPSLDGTSFDENGASVGSEEPVQEKPGLLVSESSEEPSEPPLAAVETRELKPAVSEAKTDFNTKPEPPDAGETSSVLDNEPEHPSLAGKAAQQRQEQQVKERSRRQSAQALFMAKQHKPFDSNRRQWYLLGVVVLLLLIGGGYLWFLATGNEVYPPPVASTNFDQGGRPADEFQDASNNALLPDIPTESVFADDSGIHEPSFSPVPETVAATDSSAEPESVFATSAPVEPEAPLATAVAAEVASAEPETMADTGNERVSDRVEETRPESVSQTTQVASTEALPTEPEPRSTINVSRRIAPRIDPQVSQAYAELRSGDMIAAKSLYESALRNLPNNRDALLGLAAIALASGQAGQARDYYAELLNLDPRDALARAGLLEALPSSDPVRKEGELRQLREQYPEVPQVAFGLGNFLSLQGRWAEAQQAYFDALLIAKAEGTTSVLADYAFNLAVSLERLNQPRPAFTYYQEALMYSQQNSTASFDMNVLQERLESLGRILP